MRYDVFYREIRYTYTADTAVEALGKFCRRKLFGKPLITDAEIALEDDDGLLAFDCEGRKINVKKAEP